MARNDIADVACAAIILHLIIQRRRRRLKKRTIWVTEWIKYRQMHGRIQTFNGGTIRLGGRSGYSKFLRMDPESFGLLESLVAPFISRKDTNMRRCIPAGEHLAVTLRLLATGR